MVKHKPHKFGDIGSTPIIINLLSLSNITKMSFNYYKKPTQKYWLAYYLTIFDISKIFLYTYLTFSDFKLKNAQAQKLTNYYFLYFLKHEPFYTKLKYSRVPQFDTSSGAAASFLSGMYGFLVCEKFGFELIDSGDFLYLIIYIVLYYFLGSLLLQILNNSSNLLHSLFLIFKSFKV